MKREINRSVFFGVIAVFAVAVAWFLWQYTENPYNRPGASEAQYRVAEQQAKQLGIDPRKDQFLAPYYYKYHPEEKRPEREAGPPPVLLTPSPQGTPAGPPAPNNPVAPSSDTSTGK
jgi:hypothetical protein